VVPGAALAGALLLVAADLAARSVLAPVELPVGVATTVLGVPLLLLALRRQRW
jgi:iron complex transport system permease protein